MQRCSNQGGSKNFNPLSVDARDIPRGALFGSAKNQFHRQLSATFSIQGLKPSRTERRRLETWVRNVVAPLIVPDNLSVPSPLHNCIRLFGVLPVTKVCVARGGFPLHRRRGYKAKKQPHIQNMFTVLFDQRHRPIRSPLPSHAPFFGQFSYPAGAPEAFVLTC
jgi:hypothetical protein